MKGLTPNESMLKKLSPSNVRLSPKMRWLVDSATGQDHGSRGPRGEAPQCLQITSDGFLQAGSMFIGTADDFDQNLQGLFACVKLTKKEKLAFLDLYEKHSTDWRVL